MKQAAQGSGGIAIPGSVPNVCACGTGGRGLMVNFNGSAVVTNSMISEGFASLNDSVGTKLRFIHLWWFA